MGCQCKRANIKGNQYEITCTYDLDGYLYVPIGTCGREEREREEVTWELAGMMSSPRT